RWRRSAARARRLWRTGGTKTATAIPKGVDTTKSDVPAEWTSTKGESSGQALRGIRECKRINTAVADAKKNNPRARSREFADPVQEHATSAENAVYAFPNERAATRFVSAYQGAAAAACFDKLAAEGGEGRPPARPAPAAPAT